MKPLALVLATIAIIASATSRSAQPAEVSVRPSWQAAPATAGQGEAPQSVTPTSPATESVGLVPASGGGSSPRQLSDKGGVWGTPPPTDAGDVTQSGLASWMPERYGARYLALPIGRGHRVELCGPGGCVTLTSTDAGPDLAMQRAGRVADVGVRTWERVCAVGRKYGLCEVSWTVR